MSAELCEGVRESCSARHDGEEAPLAAQQVASHLRSCAGCSGYAAALEGLDRRLRREALGAVPDSGAAVLERIAAARRARRAPLVARAAAVVLVAASVPVGAVAGLTHAVVRGSDEATPCTARLLLATRDVRGPRTADLDAGSAPEAPTGPAAPAAATTATAPMAGTSAAGVSAARARLPRS